MERSIFGDLDDVKKKSLNYKDFSEFLKSLLSVDLTTEEFEKMSESDKIEFRRNFKLNQLLDEKISK